MVDADGATEINDFEKVWKAVIKLNNFKILKIKIYIKYIYIKYNLYYFFFLKKMKDID